ncbi:MAG TPA: M28 family peptidase [Solirubrobacteraceae bacterium]|nr:M28 family peptidase [Solirubrobacteraceae bacterium]
MRRLPLIAAVLALPGAAVARPVPAEQQQQPTAYQATLHLARTIGSRPAASAGERRAHRYVAARFRAAGLRVGFERFAVPGRGRSRDVIGAFDTPARCLTILMAHADTVPPGPGANDNASGVGVLVALAARLRAGTQPPCDVWLVATGAEERPFTGQPDHLGALALVRRVTRLRRRADLRLALSLDEVGRGGRFFLQSPHPRPRPGVERAILGAARRAGVTVRFSPDSGTGNSDHREFELSSLPAAKLGPWHGTEACRHRPCDTWRRLDRGTLNRALAIAAGVARGGP